MILLGKILEATAGILSFVILVYYILLIAHVILSWVSPDPRNPIVQFIYSSTEPVLAKVRSYIPPLGMLDLSPIIVFFGIYIVDIVIVGTLNVYGQQLVLSGQRSLRENLTVIEQQVAPSSGFGSDSVVVQ